MADRPVRRMVEQVTADIEHELPDAKRRFSDAIQALVGQTTTLIQRDDGTTTRAFGQPLYRQLRDYIAGAQGTGNGSHARSMPPVVIDAVDLCDQIDRTTRQWTGTLAYPDTIARLTALEDHKWTPQAVQELRDMTADLTWWASRARELLDPPRRWTIPAACPECETATVYRPDSAGETVRQPALQIGMHGCSCLHCRTFWPPESFGILAAAIGVEKETV